MAVKSLSVRSCLIDGEAIVCDESGLSTFELLRGYRSREVVSVAGNELHIAAR
jgi:ATP-dependent DNA ligase